MTTDTDISIIEHSLDTFRSGSAILEKNKTRAIRAADIGKKILTDIEDNGGMSPELDARCMNYLNNCSKASKEMKDERAPVTQLIDLVKKQFTEAEALVDVKKESSVAFQVQSNRNQWSKQLYEEDQRKKRQAEIEAKKRQEAIDIKARAEQELLSYFNNYLATRKSMLQGEFNSMTLETFDGKKASIYGWELTYSYEHYQKFTFNPYLQYHAADEISALVRPTIEARFSQLAETFKKEMIELQAYLVDRIPSKQSELQHIAQMEEEERIRKQKLAEASEENRQKLLDDQRKADEDRRILQEAQRKRDEEEKGRIAQQDDERRKADELRISMQQNSDTALNLFNKSVESAPEITAPEARAGYNIEVKHPTGFMMIFQFWFEHEGKSLPTDKIERTSCGQMKAFCEKFAQKNGTKIESQFIEYTEVFTAVNRKTK